MYRGYGEEVNMTYDKLVKVTNMKNAIEGNISVFLRERVNGKEDGSKMIAAVIYNTIDKNYKGKDNFKLLSKRIADKDNEYFESIATYALYLFTMDYTNRMLKDMPQDDGRKVLIKAISSEVSRGLASLNMYLANDINAGVYKTHSEKTRKVMGISNEFHKAFGEYLLDRRCEIVDGIVNF